MTLHPIPSEFPYIWGKFRFHFYQCGYTLSLIIAPCSIQYTGTNQCTIFRAPFSATSCHWSSSPSSTTFPSFLSWGRPKRTIWGKNTLHSCKDVMDGAQVPLFHRVYRVPGFLSSRPNWLPPPPHPPALLKGEGRHSLAGEGRREPIQTKGQTLWNSSYLILPPRPLLCIWRNAAASRIIHAHLK